MVYNWLKTTLSGFSLENPRGQFSIVFSKLGDLLFSLYYMNYRNYFRTEIFSSSVGAGADFVLKFRNKDLVLPKQIIFDLT